MHPHQTTRAKSLAAHPPQGPASAHHRAGIFTNPGGITLTRTSGGLPITLTAGSGLSIAPLTGNVSSITLTFTGTIGVESGSLADGRWQLANPNLQYTSPLKDLNLHRLFGDANGDGTIDGNDLGSFGNAFNTNSFAFDYDNNGTVDGSDLTRPHPIRQPLRRDDMIHVGIR